MKSKISSNKSFGVIFSIFFLILGIYPLLNNQDINIIFVLLSLLFLFLGLINSKILTPLNTNWIKFGIFLGKIISPLIMLLIYFTIVLLTKVFLLIFKKDQKDTLSYDYNEKFELD
tara:strand:- start:2157 stop:2504 length:348 start_codon:yes stop_codon:yes gene_type:complete